MKRLPIIYVFVFLTCLLSAQEGEYLKIERFIFNTELLRINDKGVIIPQLNRDRKSVV